MLTHLRWNICDECSCFASDISGVETAVLPTLENFETQSKEPFSELEKIFERVLIPCQLLKMVRLRSLKNLQAIEISEAKAYEELDLYVNKLHVIKRYMEKRNLPGIPQSFLVFFSANYQIEALMDELSRGRINIDAVMRLTKYLKTPLIIWKRLLLGCSKCNLDWATLNTQTLPSFEPAVQSSFEHALKLFELIMIMMHLWKNLLCFGNSWTRCDRSFCIILREDTRDKFVCKRKILDYGQNF